VSLRVVVAGRPWLLQIWRADAVHELRRARARGAAALKRGRWFDTAASDSGQELLLVLPAPNVYAAARTAPTPTPSMGRFEPTPIPSAEPETR
jgi:hypothetical protein